MANPPAAPNRLLIVDPDEPGRILLRRRFTRIGYEVLEAGDAAKAQSLIAMIPFDLVLLAVDINGEIEGEVGGLEVLRRVRESRSATELPIIMITDPSAREDAVEALRRGANDCLARPVDVEIAYLRAEMQVRRKRGRGDGGARRRGLESNLLRLQRSVVQAEHTAARLADMGVEARAPLAGVVNAAKVLTPLCDTPDLKKGAAQVDEAAAALERLIVRSMGREDRRARTPRTQIRVLSADDDAQSRLAMRAILHAAEIEVELVDVATGLQAAVAAEGRVFDLIVINVATAEAIAGIRAIRRDERQNKMRRTPILAIAPGAADAARALAAGADLPMGLPITAESLLTALAGAVSRQSDDLSAVA
jgi:PleD family two-component response regulator